MVSNTLHNLEESRNWVLWQITIGSMVCLCCVVFMGLKLKWFRAQLRLGESPKNNSTTSVQGVGFKMKTNPDDFQVYKVISEFAPVTPQVQQKPQSNATQNKNKNGTSMTAVTVKPNVKPSTNTSTAQNTSKETPVNKPNLSKNVTQTKNSTSMTADNPNVKPNLPAPQNPSKQTVNKPNTTNNKAVSPKKQAPKPEVRPILKQQPTEARQHKNSVNFDSEVTEISSPNDQKYSDLINNKQTENIDEYQQLTTAPQFSFQTKNPLATRTFTMPVEDEDEWKIKIVDEKPKQKPQPKKQENEYFTAPQANINSNMYSSQAASIFFAGQAPVAQPRARKFVEMDEDDNVSTGSQTSA